MTAFWSDYDTDYARSLINVVTRPTVCSSNLGLNSQRSRAVTSFEIMKTIEAAVGTARQTAAALPAYTFCRLRHRVGDTVNIAGDYQIYTQKYLQWLEQHLEQAGDWRR